jgi:hypothetical protein
MWVRETALRRIALLLVVAVVIVAAALIGGRAWVRGQDYLRLGSSFRPPATSHPAPPDPGDGKAVALVPYRDGAPVSYGLKVRNDGPLSVKVTEVATEKPGESLSMFRTVGVKMAAREQPGAGASVPFRPFTLEPDHERYVEVEGVFGNCEHYAPGSAEFIDSQPVRFDVLKQSLTENVELPSRIEWRYSAATCPRKRVTGR